MFYKLTFLFLNIIKFKIMEEKNYEVLSDIGHGKFSLKT
jgi:hypothetical protein